MLDVGALPGLPQVIGGLDETHVRDVPENLHVTLLYGITEPVAPQQAPAWWKLSHTFNRISDLAPETLNIDTRPSLFRNDNFDVLKFDVYNMALPEIHSFLRDRFETEVEFGYRAHMTAAYLQPGTGRQYLNRGVGVDWLDVTRIAYTGPECRERITRPL